MRKGLSSNLQRAKSAFKKSAYSQQNIRFTAPNNVSKLGGNETYGATTPAENEIMQRAKRGTLKFQSPPNRRDHGVQQIALRGAMKRRRCIIRTMRRHMELPNAMSAPWIPFHRSAEKYFATEATGLRKGVLDIQVPNAPFC